MVRRVGSGVIAVAAGLALVAATMWWWDVSGPVPILQALYPAVAVGAVLRDVAGLGRVGDQRALGRAHLGEAAVRGAQAA